MAEQLHPQEIRQQCFDTLNFADSILSGEYESVVLEQEDESMDPSERFSGPILDLNDPDLSDQEREYVLGWMRRQLGADLVEAPVQGRYASPDGQARVEVYEKPLGQEEDRWFLSKWQNEGEEPSYVLWQEEVYEWQLEEAGYTVIEDEDVS